MQSTFRVALGPCTCKAVASGDIDESICRELLKRLTSLRSENAAVLGALPLYVEELCQVGDRDIRFETIREPVSQQDFLIVVRAFLSTWRRPTWLSFAGVGRLYADGIIVRSSGSIEDAPDELMWGFR